MYNLLVQYMPWEPGSGTVLTSRLFEYTDDELVDRFTNGDAILLDKLIQHPCLFMREGTEDEPAQIGAITRARSSGKNVLIDYVFDPNVQPLSNKVILDNKDDFDIRNTFEFHRTHWALKDVDLFRTLLRLSQPLRRNPRVFSISKNETIERRLVSVMMPYDSAFSPVYESLKDAATEVGMVCRRADEIWENPAIIQDIVNLIDKSFVVVCDCTGRNANVFYEIGIAHTLGREVILITQNSADVPFDLRHLRYIGYLNNAEGRQTLEMEPSKRLKYLQENL